ncbi:MAG: autotransporter outer membrane beta-barrel domain-containing protein [Lewinellaceae bacterium]|nr:hypothetical protein [Saprospiraceae bacterium]MCB9343794.1 autotransporter outer membrane beta-barrel domain-containing protein [Lewinellaceae bacterium]
MRLYILLLVVLFAYPNFAKSQSDTLQNNPFFEKLSHFSLSGYGAMNYYNFDWQTDTAKRNVIDNERFIIQLGYKWNDKIRLNSEIEFEHGGTGSEVEFDRFEEFGEFEFDISKGGEVLLEQMNLEFTFKKRMHLQIGRVKVPFGLMFKQDEPTDYLTAINSEMETQMLPENWTDNGLLFYGHFGKKRNWQYHVGFVNGLDGSAFNSANWIKRGNQRRFEMVNAENFAISGRLDYQFSKGAVLGFSAYGGNTTGNRPKPDLKVQTPIGIAELHFVNQSGPVLIKSMLLYGALGNSEALTNQNRNLSNNLNVKRTPVGAAVLGALAEVGFTVFGQGGVLFKSWKTECLLYGRYDYYDTMFKTQGLVFNNPRWERQSITIGSVIKIIDDVHLKLQYSLREVGAPAATSVNGGTSEKTFIGGFAFEF